jgi:hypothetical protein
MESEDSFGRYRRCLCTFVDVLGFRELVAASSEDKQAKSKVHTILKHFQQNYHSKGIPGDCSSSEPAMIVKAFSDSIVRIVPLDDVASESEEVDLKSEIIHEIIDLCGAQFDLLTMGILVRGGVAIGDLYWDSNQIFGPALTRAYDLEHNFAVYPRIVLDTMIADQIKGERCGWLGSDYACQDFDGAWFVDYLGFYTAMLDPHIVFHKDQFHQPFEVFRSHILKNLSGSQALDRTRLKRMWLAKYFNRIVTQVPSEFRERWSLLSIPI